MFSISGFIVVSAALDSATFSPSDVSRSEREALTKGTTDWLMLLDNASWVSP